MMPIAFLETSLELVWESKYKYGEWKEIKALIEIFHFDKRSRFGEVSWLSFSISGPRVLLSFIYSLIYSFTGFRLKQARAESILLCSWCVTLGKSLLLVSLTLLSNVKQIHTVKRRHLAPLRFQIQWRVKKMGIVPTLVQQLNVDIAHYNTDVKKCGMLHTETR